MAPPAETRIYEHNGDLVIPLGFVQALERLRAGPAAARKSYFRRYASLRWAVFSTSTTRSASRT